ncbi:MAG TPA: GNAT family N-acetyltransferase, partial [Phycisphaerales bacterium]|nr:GNAT family N-acetyltransferase [Phycisphaerales bacterium]
TGFFEGQMPDSQVINQRFDDSAPEGGFRIVKVSEDMRLQAISRLLSPDSSWDASPAKRFLDYSITNRISLDHFYAMTDANGKPVACVLAVPNAGRTAMFFASRPKSTADCELVGHVVRHSGDSLKDQGVHLAQALLENQDDLLRSAFSCGGFSFLAQLSYMERPLGPARTHVRRVHDSQHADVTLESYRESCKQEMQDILAASYEGTLDCPGLRGMRDPADILEGHRATGTFVPELWTILREQGKAVGALLLNPSSQLDSIELVYLGLAPSARGRGFGHLLLEHGLHLTAHRTERVMTLAMDDGNQPAAKLYGKFGFRRVLRRVAMIRSLRA